MHLRSRRLVAHRRARRCSLRLLGEATQPRPRFSFHARRHSEDVRALPPVVHSATNQRGQECAKTATPPTTTGLRNMRSSSTRPSSIAAAARPAPPIETSLSVAWSAAASATDASASRALPWTLSSVRLKTALGIAHHSRRMRPEARCRVTTDPSPHKRGAVSFPRRVGARAGRGDPPQRALAVGDEAVHRHAHRVGHGRA
jgi:hypothetical protein